MSADNGELLVTREEIAWAAGVTVQAVSTWRSRHDGFPPQVGWSSPLRFSAAEVAAWLDTRTIDRPRLRPEETPGSTFGDRFRASFQLPPAPGAARVPARDVIAGRLLSPLRQQMSTIWETASIGSWAERLLALVWLRQVNPRDWAALRSASAREAPALFDAVTRAERVHRGGLAYLVDDVLGGQLPARSIAPVVRLLEQAIGRLYRGGVSSAEIESVICRYALGEDAGERNRTDTDFVTPPTITNLVADLLVPKPRDRIYDPCCGSGELLIAAGLRARGGQIDAAEPGPVLHGRARGTHSWRMTRLIAGIHRLSVDLGAGPANPLLRHGSAGGRYDIVLTNPPFNQSSWGGESVDASRWEFGQPPRHDGNFAWLQHCLSLLDDGGRAMVLMPNSAASGTDRRQRQQWDIRSRMIDDGVVSCVIDLPRNLFRATPVGVSLWVLARPSNPHRDEVLFIDASRMGTGPVAEGRRSQLSDIEHEMIVSAYHEWIASPPGGYNGQPGTTISTSRDEIKARADRLDPKAHFPLRPLLAPASENITLKLGQLHDELADLRSRAQIADSALATLLMALTPASPAADGWTSLPLGEVCDVKTGPSGNKQLLRSEAPDAVPLLRPTDIKALRIANTGLDMIDWKTAHTKLEQYLLQQGDLVLSRIEGTGYRAIVGPHQHGWAFGTSLTRLRPATSLRADFLHYYLGQRAVRDELTRRSSGAALRAISADSLRRLTILLPPPHTQQAIVDALASCGDVTALHHQISDVTVRIQELLAPRLLAGALQPPLGAPAIR
jgi:type I restriction enzyme M protein